MVPHHFARSGAALMAALVAGALLSVPAAAQAVPPTAVDDNYSVGAGAVFTTGPGDGLKANDRGFEVPGIAISIKSMPEFGSLADLWLDGRFPYEPDPGFVGVDSFTYCLKVLTDPCAGPDATVSLTVSSVLERIGGADRFAVSAAVSKATFPSGVDTVYIASGEVFPDALSASAAAGLSESPVLLTRRDRLPSAIIDELTRLQPKRVVIVGGTATVSASVESQLRERGADVERVAGADRYAGSALLSAETFDPSPEIVFIASGEKFPDALTASAAAGKTGGPVLLVRPGAVPSEVAAELTRLRPQAVQLVGGADSLSEAVRLEIDRITGRASDRISGSDRYDVALGVLSKYFTSLSTPTVFIASGEVFPDALSGAAAAIAAGAPTLLVTRDGVRNSVLDQLDRLKVTRIVVLGGTDTVSNAVSQQLDAHLQ
ncbi:MAG: cell wall-binding repeat-containing protein [Herbiconiux sp.]|nr:cell wall-binding repeat-containing protein [Herbiconiux sp.]